MMSNFTLDLTSLTGVNRYLSGKVMARMSADIFAIYSAWLSCGHDHESLVKYYVRFEQARLYA